MKHRVLRGIRIAEAMTAALVCSSAAQAPPPPAEPTAPSEQNAPPSGVPPLAVQERQPIVPAQGEPSVATEDEMTGPPARERDPFWPVGYAPRKRERPQPVRTTAATTPTPRVTEQSPIDWEQAQKKLEIRGISHIGRDKTEGGEKYLAVVNGRIVETDDVVAVVLEGRLYRWRIQSIGFQGLALVKLDVRTP